jgi:hypothetical protein
MLWGSFGFSAHQSYIMKQLTVPFTQELSYDDPISDTSGTLSNQERHLLEYLPWPRYSYKPNVHFTLAHCHDCIFIKFFIREKSIRAATSKINGAVWKDTCVEFFISFGEEAYYNLEFNCIGTILAGYGTSRTGRQPLTDEIIRKIRYGITISNVEEGIYWELTASIPLAVFVHSSLHSLTSRQCKANFSKCGDELDDPHFVSWVPIQAQEPNFHLPAFFGVLDFQ